MIILVLLSALGAVIIFGASPVAAKVAVQSLPALDVALLRTVIGGLIALPVVLMLRVGLPRVRAQQQLLLLSGFCGFLGFPLLFTFGVVLTSANHASMILALLPVLTGAIAMAWDRRWPPWKWWTGCVLAVCGEAILIFVNGTGATGATPEGDLLVLVSCVFASLGYVAGGRLQLSGYPARGTTFWGVSIFALLLLPLTPFAIDITRLQAAPREAWLALLYLAVGVTIIGYMLWYWALGTGGIARIGLVQFLQPVSGVILAWMLLGEVISGHFLLASALILTGVVLAFRPK